MKPLNRLFTVLILLVIAFSFVSPVIAAGSEQIPLSEVIDDIYIYRNLAETGDVLFLFSYEVAYASDNYPTTPASKAVIFRLYDSSDVIKQTASPYVYPVFDSNGYGTGIGSFYFGSSDNASAWEDLGRIEISGSSVFFTEAWVKSVDISIDDYVSPTTQEGNRELLKGQILLVADELTADYQTTGVILKADSDIGTVLSSYGETYFRGAIPGLQALCPELFFIQTLIPEQMEVVPYNMSLAATYATRLTGDDLGLGFERMATLLNVSTAFFQVGLVFVAGIILSVFTHKKGWGVEPGLLATAVIGVGMAILVGDIVFTIMMLVSLIAVLGIIWLFVLRKA